MRLIDRNAQTNRWRRIPAGDKVALALGMMVVSLCVPGWMVQGLIILIMWIALLAGARLTDTTTYANRATQDLVARAVARHLVAGAGGRPARGYALAKAGDRHRTA